MAFKKNISKKAVYYISDNFELYQKCGLPYHIEKDVTFDNCYIQITNIEGDKNKMSLEVTSFENDTKENVLNVSYYTFEPIVTSHSKNFIKQGYEYLKTLEEYADATDILEE